METLKEEAVCVFQNKKLNVEKTSPWAHLSGLPIQGPGLWVRTEEMGLLFPLAPRQ